MKMILPPNWDKASEGNDILCSRFERRVFRQVLKSLPYRLFTPYKAVVEARERSLYPLVLYLHGADAAGDDNDIQLSMHDIGTVLARDDMQSRHPCYILAPQYGEMRHWAMPEIREPLWALLNEIIEAYEDIDRQRVYIYGYSAGGVGLLRLLKENPGIFAAAVSICGATGLSDIDSLLETPLWLVHAVDDSIVRSTYRTDLIREPANLGSADIFEHFAAEQGKGSGRELSSKGEVSVQRLDRFRDRRIDLRYTEYPAGYMQDKLGINPHCSWAAVSDAGGMEIWEWMFHKRQ